MLTDYHIEYMCIAFSKEHNKKKNPPPHKSGGVTAYSFFSLLIPVFLVVVKALLPDT